MRVRGKRIGRSVSRGAAAPVNYLYLLHRILTIHPTPTPVFPLIRHEIRDLPPTHQSTIRQLYIQWLALLGTLVINLVGCILLLIAGSSDGG